jgi:hypothetical protein
MSVPAWMNSLLREEMPVPIPNAARPRHKIGFVPQFRF